MNIIIEALGNFNYEDVIVVITTLKNTLCNKNALENLQRFREDGKKITLFPSF